MSAAVEIPSWAESAVHPNGGRPLSATEFHKALHKCNQLEMRMSRIRELQLSSYILIFDRATWRFLYSHARGRFQRQLCMGQRSWSAWEYTGRSHLVRSKKTGKTCKFSEQAMKIDSIENLLRRAGYKDPNAINSTAEGAPVHHITSDVHASSKKRIVSTLLVGITSDEWNDAARFPWTGIAHAKEALRQDPTEGGLRRAREHARAAWHTGLFDRECWLAPPFEWIIEVESKRYVRRPKPKAPEAPVQKKTMKSIVTDGFDIEEFDPW